MNFQAFVDPEKLTKVMSLVTLLSLIIRDNKNSDETQRTAQIDNQTTIQINNMHKYEKSESSVDI